MATALSRPVPTNFWIRPDINEEYTLDEKLLYIYLITNEHFQQHAIYKLSKNMMMIELGMDKDKFNQAFDNLENKYKVIKYSEVTREVAILDYYSFGILKGGKPLNDCFENLGKKVEDFTLLRAIYDRSLKIMDDREAFKTVMKMVKEMLISVGQLEVDSSEDDYDDGLPFD